MLQKVLGDTLSPDRGAEIVPLAPVRTYFRMAIGRFEATNVASHLRMMIRANPSLAQLNADTLPCAVFKIVVFIICVSFVDTDNDVVAVGNLTMMHLFTVQESLEKSTSI